MHTIILLYVIPPTIYLLLGFRDIFSKKTYVSSWTVRVFKIISLSYLYKNSERGIMILYPKDEPPNSFS